ncbi:GNAT family N-acetyltransferase [Flavobacterium subsaxonicum]|uniref:GNAT family acetyltransferase n=1 Tax=Flavobacterium subsaxonicum WB 4.1-42 = DSM 21790 TaxID=1121898 RepID=A0A0A2MTZ0_9FLAO|nr:GNAT family N-acetyltransferase [Flavobacterium subsaxonicum]KGO91665.1 GNAT family acetyltransferase [Flavobacterium subsaxonicum WB 4.1-42 = DSM 21790]
MEIQHFDDKKKGHFRAIEGETEAGIMTYVWAGDDKFIIEHTVGNPEFKGVGLKMLDSAVAFARANGKKIIPLCPFAKKMFDRKPEIHDVLSQ